MQVIKTKKTFSTPAKAEAFLSKLADLNNVKWLIACVPGEGWADTFKPCRFAPVVVGAENVALIHLGVTVVG